MILHTAFLYSAIAAFCWLLDKMHLPVAWMIGSLIGAGILNLFGHRLRLPPRAQSMGLAVVSATLGLSFTQEALLMVSGLFPVMILAAILSLACSLSVAWFLMKIGRISYLAACLALVSIGPVESSQLAQRYRLDPTPIIFSQLLRFVALVLFVPPILYLLHGASEPLSQVMRGASSTVIGTGLLLSAAAIGVSLAMRLHVPNPWFLGPAVLAMSVQLADLPITAPPYPLLAVAQMAMGLWLGAVVDRTFLRRSGHYTAVAICATVALLMASAAAALLVVVLSDLPWQVVVMATAPGASTELALTAKSLGFGTATVVGFHAVRILLIYFIAPWVIAKIAKLVQA